MSYIPKVWQARFGTNLNKFTKSAETASSVILTNAPDAITVPGTNFTADAMNNIESAIQDTRGELSTFASELTAGLTDPYGITTDGTYLYVTEYSTGKVKKIVISTGVASELTTGLTDPYGITTDGTYLYVTDTGSGKVKKIVISTGVATELTTGLTIPFGITTDGTYLYVTENSTSKVKKIVISTGVATELTTGLTNPFGITTDGTYLYVTEAGSGKVKKIVISTGVATELTTGLTNPYSITTDGTYLYVTEYGTGKVKKIVISTGVASELTTGLTIPFGITTDGTYLYVTENSTSKVKKITFSTGDFISPSAILPQTVTTANVTITEDRYGNVLLSGTLTGIREVILPATIRAYKIINNCTGAYYVHIKTASGTGVYSAPGDVWDVRCDGTNIVPVRGSSPNIVEISGSPATNLSPNSLTKIIALSAGGDVLSQWSSANQRFVVKNNGVLSVLFQGSFSSTSGRLYENHQCMVKKNGVIVNPPSYVFVDGSAGSAYNAWPTATINIPVKAGDYIEFYCMSAVSVDTRIAVFYAKILQIS